MTDAPRIAPGLRHLAAPLSDLEPDPENARAHPAESLRALKRSLSEHGQDQPIVARRANGRIIKGNGRYLAALSLGWEEAAVLFVEDGELEAVRRGLSDHGSERLGFEDDERLGRALQQAGHEDRPVAGFDDADLERLLKGTAASGSGGGRGGRDAEGPSQVVLYVTAEEAEDVRRRLAAADPDGGGSPEAGLLRLARAWTEEKVEGGAQPEEKEEE